MLKKDITYEDFDGNPAAQTYYFNLSKAELTEWELSTKGGLRAHLEAIVADENGEEIVKTFKKIILDAIGQKSGDGQRFVKSAEIRTQFQQSPAYSELFMALVTDAAAAAEFINGIVPANLGEEISRLIEVSRESSGIEKAVGGLVKPTDAELNEHAKKKAAIANMSEEELRQKLIQEL